MVGSSYSLRPKGSQKPRGGQAPSSFEKSTAAAARNATTCSTAPRPRVDATAGAGAFPARVERWRPRPARANAKTAVPPTAPRPRPAAAPDSASPGGGANDGRISRSGERGPAGAPLKAVKPALPMQRAATRKRSPAMAAPLAPPTRLFLRRRCCICRNIATALW